MVKFFSICLVVLLLCSCHSRRKEIARIVEEWKNKEVIFPDPLLVKVQGRDTILPDFQERKYKILNYIDTSGCTECRMKLAEWQLLKQEIDSLGYDVDILGPQLRRIGNPATCQSLSATLPIRSAGGYAKNQPVSCRTGFPNFPARFAQPGPAYR